MAEKGTAPMMVAFHPIKKWSTLGDLMRVEYNLNFRISEVLEMYDSNSKDMTVSNIFGKRTSGIDVCTLFRHQARHQQFHTST